MPQGMQLWMASNDNAETTRFFLVPRGLKLPSGPLTVRSLQLSLLEVDPDGIEPFEVSATEAQAHIDAGWSGFVGSIRDVAERVLGSSASALPDPTEWLGITPGEAVVDPVKRREGGRTLLAQMGSMIGRPIDEAELDRMEAQLKGMRDTVSEQGGRLVRTLEHAADAAVDAMRGREAQHTHADDDDEGERS